MSKSEMPPLATGQVWEFDEHRATIGRYLTDEDEFSVDWSHLGTRWEYANFVREYLSKQGARLIHGPGAPWSPEEPTR